MRSFLLRAGAVFAVSAAVGSCAPELDTRRQPAPRGTLGEEVFRVLCERVNVGENPSDLMFERARGACTRGLGASDPAPDGVRPKVVALGRLRAGLARALDQAMPESLETSLDGLLVQLLPLYGPDGSGRRDPTPLPDGGVRSLVLLPDGGTAPAEDLLPQTTRAVASQLDAIVRDVPALHALERASRRQCYRPVTVSVGLARPLLAYERLDPMLDDLLRLVRDEGLNHPAGSANAHWNTLLATLQGELSTAAPSTDTRGGTTLDVATDLFFRSESGLARGRSIDLVRRDASGNAIANMGTPTGSDRPTPFACAEVPPGTRDAAGRATVGGAPAYRYVDLDGTMLAAVARQLPPLLTPRTDGNLPALQLLRGASALFGPRRATTRNYNEPARTGCSDPTPPRNDVSVDYQSFTAEGSPVVDLAHAAGQLLTYRDVDAALNTTRALVAPEREALLARALGAMLSVDAVSDRHPEAVLDPRSNVWDDVMDIVREIAQEPGLLEDILAALGEVGARDARPDPLGHTFAEYTRYRDRVEPDWSARGFPIRTTSLSTPVNRAMPDTPDNRSAMQRVLHLIDDLNNAPLCNKPGARVRVSGIPLVGGVTLATAERECEIFRVQDAASFFLRSVVGRSKIDMHIPGLSGTLLRGVQALFPSLADDVDGLMDALIEQQSGVPGFDSSPTPEAIARMVFRPDTAGCRTGDDFLCNLINPALTRQGLEVRREHPGVIFVWELYGFYDAVRPLARAFVRHDRESCKPGDSRRPGEFLCADPNNVTGYDGTRGSRLFVRLMSALHKHWATNRSGTYQSRTDCATCVEGRNYSTMDGLARYEPILSEALDGDLLPALNALSAQLPNIRGVDPANPARTGRDAIASFARALVDPAVLPVRYRNGRTATVRSDGTTPVPEASLYHLFADAFLGMDRAFAADRAALTDWEAARSATVDQLLTVSGTGPSARWQNRTTPAILRLTVPWLQERIGQHRAAGDLAQWGAGLEPCRPGLGLRLANVVRGPLFASAIDLTLDLNNDPSARANTAALLTHLLNETGGNDREASAFATALTSVADLFQIARDDEDADPILRALAPMLRPREGLAARSLVFLDRARSYDDRRVLTSVLANLVRRPSAGDALAPEPLVTVADAIAETHRVSPGAGGPLDAADFREVFLQVRDFFRDNSRGMEQFYFIVQNRRLP